MALQEIFNLLNEKIGLNPDSIGESSIERAVHHRIAHHGLHSRNEYLALLNSDTKEVNELIEEVVVPETWFFRNKIPFEAFRTHVKKQLLPKVYKKKPIRILSVPCATGEEPYSLVLSLLEENINPQFFRVDAMDVSKKAIELAKEGLFGKNSFRDVDPGIREKYFKQTERGWLIDDAVKKLVKFKQGNILLGSLSPHPGYYDVVFCRNLLIYFDREIQQMTLEKLYRTLKKGAILFVGHAESSHVSERFFERSWYTKSFSFIKRDKPLKNAEDLPQTVGTFSTKLNNVRKQGPGFGCQRILKESVETARQQSVARKSIADTTAKNTDKKKTLVESLRPVEKLINQGSFTQAQKMCLNFLEYQPESAHGHYLLGLIKNSLGEYKSAESLLKKAVYLDPNHEQALLLSCLIAEQKGDQEAVESFKRRIERVQNRKKRKQIS